MGLKIVFWGTPDFAIPVLRKLAERYEVVAVVTKADRPKGRGNKMAFSPVKIETEKMGIPILQPESVRTAEFAAELAAFDADLFVTAAYGKILPEAVLKIPRLGCVNVHASILPYYRGAAPLWWPVLNGDAESGVTTMLTDVGMDTGDILLCRKLPIGENMTTGELSDALSQMGAELITETIDGLLDGSVKPVPQEHEKATYAPMIDREVGRLHWQKSAREIHNTVRGCDPFPGAFSYLNGEKIKIWKTEVCAEEELPETCDAATGTVLFAKGDTILVAAGEGAVRILELQGESAKRMNARAYLSGHPIPEGSVFTEDDGKSL